MFPMIGMVLWKCPIPRMKKAFRDIVFSTCCSDLLIKTRFIANYHLTLTEWIPIFATIDFIHIQLEFPRVKLAVPT